jgi:hypothetical protein
MEVKKDLIGKKTPSVAKIAKKHGVSAAKIRRQIAHGTKVEREHTKKGPEAAEIARDHLAEIPDYYTRLKKMEKEAGVKEAWVDPIEKLHKLNRARILQGAKEGKYWLLRSEDVGMTEEERKNLIAKIVETTTTGAIGGFNMPMAGRKDDPAFGGRNRFTKQQLRFAVQRLLGKSVKPPTV